MKRKVTTRSVLVRARTILSRPKAWAKGADARLANNRLVEPTHPKACKFCLRGAVFRAARELDAQHRTVSAMNALSKAIPEDPHSEKTGDVGVVGFNDHFKTKKPDVLRLLSAAIKRARE